MAYDPRALKYPAGLPNQHSGPNITGYAYHPGHSIQHIQQTDENRNENNYGNKEAHSQISHQSSGTQTIQKIDVATMTDPLQIDFRLTSEYLARCSSTLGLPYAKKHDDNNSPHNCQEIKPKLEYEVEPQHFNGMLVFHCPECAYRFEDREALHEHLEDHRQRPHICDICGASLKRKEHLDRHKQGHNKDRPYQCGMCCKAFKRNEHLARHMIIHSGSKNQICKECGKAFYRKDHLKKHLQSHNSTRSKSLTNLQGHQNGQNTNEDMDNFGNAMRHTSPPFSVLRT
ncbi:zinc finger and SCAN domain-containing protein 31-like [Prorops nasuta]|uniref:zinc finger and SCAN domain-containing protein 31-like n=1 Tax=Prorops nasuta TaxID=863751 RepID=UPI0034CDAFA6